MSHSRKQNFELSNADDLKEVTDILASNTFSDLSESDLDEDKGDTDYQSTCVGNAEVQFSNDNNNSTGHLRFCF